MNEAFEKWWTDSYGQWPDFVTHRPMALTAFQAGWDAVHVKYGCHCDLEPGQEPDGCVLNGDGDYCVYAHCLREQGKKAIDCEYWRPV